MINHELSEFIHIEDQGIVKNSQVFSAGNIQSVAAQILPVVYKEIVGNQTRSPIQIQAVKTIIAENIIPDCHPGLFNI